MIKAITTGDGFITNEQWIADQETESLGCDDEVCWVEAGYWKTPGNSQKFFFADRRPGAGVFVMNIATVAGQFYDKQLKISFWKNPDSWSIRLEVPNSWTWQGYSTINRMNAEHIQIGMELQGTNGSSVTTAGFNYNKWRESNGTWHYQTEYPNPAIYDLIYRPPYGGWTIPPNQSSTGGTWWTSCCS